MLIRPRRNRNTQASLIEDVVMPHADAYTDVSRDEVRRRSVGNLQSQFDRAQKRNRVAVSARRRKAPRSNFTFVPPLGSLPDIYSGTSTFAVPVWHGPETLIRNIGGKIADTWSWLASTVAATPKFFIGLLPKRYTASSGLTPDWETAADRSSILIPSILILIILALFIYGFLTSSDHLGVAIKKTQPLVLQTTNNSDGQSAKKTANGNSTNSVIPSSQSAAPVSPSAAALTTPSSPLPSSSPGGLVGGMGGGPSPATPGLPVNLNLQVPPASVGADGKTLIDETGTGLTIN